MCNVFNVFSNVSSVVIVKLIWKVCKILFCGNVVIVCKLLFGDKLGSKE